MYIVNRSGLSFTLKWLVLVFSTFSDKIFSPAWCWLGAGLAPVQPRSYTYNEWMNELTMKDDDWSFTSDGGQRGTRWRGPGRGRARWRPTVYSTVQVYRTGYLSLVQFSTGQYRCTEPAISHLYCTAQYNIGVQNRLSLTWHTEEGTMSHDSRGTSLTCSTVLLWHRSSSLTKSQLLPPHRVRGSRLHRVKGWPGPAVL